MTPGATVVLVPFNDEQRALIRLLRDVLPSLRLYRSLIDFEIIAVDNSDRRSERLAETLGDHGGFASRYVWNEGRNLQYGPAINLAVRLSSRPLLLYVCSRHGRMRDPTWIWDLLHPLVLDPSVAMTGSLYPSGAPSDFGFPDTMVPTHIQGGVFAARTDVLAKHPYPDGERAHYGADIHQSYVLRQAGYRLAEVPTVKSVWRATVTGNWKYVHDESEP